MEEKKVKTVEQKLNFLNEKPQFEKVEAFLERPVEISEEFLRESGRLDENIVIVNKKMTKSNE